MHSIPKKPDGTKWKLFYYGDLGAPTGFSTVSKNILKGLYDTGLFDIVVYAINNWGEPSPEQKFYKIIPSSNDGRGDPYGRERLYSIISDPKSSFDLFFSLQDTFIIKDIDKALRRAVSVGKSFKSIGYYPIDATPKSSWIETMNAFDCPVAYTKYGYSESVKVFPGIMNKLSIIPHGVNTEEFFPIESKEYVDDFKRSYFSNEKVRDKFLFMRIDRNQRRKDYPRTFIAFKEFLNYRQDAALYCHCAVNDFGWNLVELAKSTGLRVGEDVIFPKDFSENHGIPVEVINKIYNSVDCVLSSATGEGWGLCLHPESRVKTQEGFKEIKDVKIGDLVLTREGSKPVVNTFSRNVSEEIVCITAQKRSRKSPLKLTKNHPVLTERGWVEAGDLKKEDKLYYHTNLFEYKGQLPTEEVFVDLYSYCKEKLNLCMTEKEIWLYGFRKASSLSRFVRLSKNFAELYGLYLAEGSSDKSGIVFSISSKEIDLKDRIIYLAKNVFGLDNARIEVKGTKMWVRFSSLILKEFFVAISGRGSKNKSIKLLPRLNRQAASKVLKGIWLGDGSEEPECYEITTASKSLAYDILYLGDLLGIRFSFEVFNRLSKFESSKGQYLTSYRLRTGKQGQKVFYHILNNTQVDGENFVLSKIKKHSNMSPVVKFKSSFIRIKELKTEVYNGLVYDITVDGCHEFMTDHCLVHNCSTESFATKTPFIGARNTATTEIVGVNEERGYLINSGTDINLWTALENDEEVLRPLVDVNHMVEKMIHVYDNYDEALEKADKAYEWVNKLDWKKNIVPIWLVLFGKVLDQLLQDRVAIQALEGSIKTRRI